jgi:hypothetical protein
MCGKTLFPLIEKRWLGEANDEAHGIIMWQISRIEVSIATAMVNAGEYFETACGKEGTH